MGIKIKEWSQIWDVEGIQLVGYFHNVVFSLFMSNATGIQATELKSFVEELLKKEKNDLKFYFTFTTYMLATQDLSFKNLLCSFAAKTVTGIEVPLSADSITPEEFTEVVSIVAARFIELDKHKVFMGL